MEKINRPAHLDKKHTHWQHRDEPNWKYFEFNQPYAQGLANVRRVLAETNFDPATLWQWGTMQAMALIEVLKAAESQFGADGQKLVLEALRKVGRNIGQQVLAGTTIDERLSTDEWISFYATVINRIAYASLETPALGSAKEGKTGSANFHIDYCPHQDMYSAMDCRVQRYFVQGMIEAAREHAQAHGRRDIYDVMFRTTIPAGHATCFFVIEKPAAGEATKAQERWARYTDVLEKKNLRLARQVNARPGNP